MGMPAHQASPPGDAPQWPYHSFLPLGALPGAIPCARLHTTAVLWEWGMEALAQPAELTMPRWDRPTKAVGVPGGVIGSGRVASGATGSSGRSSTISGR